MSGQKSSSSSKPGRDSGDKASSTTSHPGSAVQTSSTGKSGRTGNEAAAMPESFGRYKIERELGKGAMGIVYLAEDTQLGRKVALKIPQRSALEDPAALERFYREAKTSSQIRHAHICPVYDVGAIDGRHYLTMAYIPGKPISCFLGKGKLPAAKAVALLFRKLALALAEAHKQGVVHRDLKPSNVMLDDRNEPIIMDFGLARQFNTEENSRITQSGAIVGTPAYMSPEQIKSDGSSIGPQSDIYSLGVMLYQFLTGELPFEGPVMMVLAQILTAQPPRPSERRPDVDPKLEVICLTMMAHDPGQRYAAMNEVAAALSAYLKGTSEASVVSGNTNSSVASAGGPSNPSQSQLSSVLVIASGASARSSVKLWAMGLGGGVMMLLVLGTIVAWATRPSMPRQHSSPEAVEVAAHDAASELSTESVEETQSDAHPDDQDATAESTAAKDQSIPSVSKVDSRGGDEPSDDLMESPEESTEEMTHEPPTTPTAPVVSSKRSSKPSTKGKGRGSAKRTVANGRSSGGKKSSPPRTTVSPKNPAAPPIAPSPEPSETERTFAQYEQAVKKAQAELVSRFDKTMKEIEKSTKLSPEEKSRIRADLQLEKATFAAKELIPFSTRMRKYAEAYCLTMDKAENALWDRLQRYGATPADIESAQQLLVPRQVGVWQCEADGERFQLRLMSNLKLESDVESRRGSWTFDEDALHLKFPDPKAPGGVWHYKCKMNASGRGFTAAHSKVPEIKGVMID